MFYWIFKKTAVTDSRCHLTKRMLVFAFPILCALCMNCDDNGSASTTYYPVDSVVTSQIKFLSTRHASVQKVAMLDSVENRTSFIPSDTNAWAKELEVFRDLKAINKPINQGLYKVADNIADSKSNLTIKTFSTTEDLPVQYLKIYYYNTIDNIRKIESKYNESNAMYKGMRYLIMEFQEWDNTPALTYYSIFGGQKMLLGDSVTYTINASVSIP